MFREEKPEFRLVDAEDVWSLENLAALIDFKVEGRPNPGRRIDSIDSLWMMYEHGGDFLDASFIANKKMFIFASAVVKAKLDL